MAQRGERGGARAGWRDRQWPALVAVSVVPLLWPGLPPFTDAPGHLGKYAVELARPDSPLLRYFAFAWRPIGNLGVELPMLALGRMFGLEPATKLLVVATVAATVLGLLMLAREAHGRVPPATVLALPLAYNHGLHLGFLNWSLAMAGALVAFAWWLRLARAGRFGTRALLFALLGVGLWFAHALGWAVLGLLALGAELVRAARGRRADGRIAAHLGAGTAALLPLAAPVLLTLAWRGDGTAPLFEYWPGAMAKARGLLGVLRDRWMWWDQLSAAICLSVAAAAAIRARRAVDPTLATAAALLGAAFLVLPGNVLGTSFVDVRLAPYALALALASIRPGAFGARADRRLLAAALLFLAARTASTTASLARHWRDWEEQLEALPRIPRGASVLVLVPSGQDPVPERRWARRRLDHLGGFAIARREAFANNEWTGNAGQPIRVLHRAAAPFEDDPSQFLRGPLVAVPGALDLPDALRAFPRPAFDHVWLVGIRPDPADIPADLVPVWRGRRDGALYRVRPGPRRVRPGPPR